MANVINALRIEARNLLTLVDPTSLLPKSQGQAAYTRLQSCAERAQGPKLSEAISDFRFVFRARLLRMKKAVTPSTPDPVIAVAFNRVYSCAHLHAVVAPSGHVRCYACGLVVAPLQAEGPCTGYVDQHGNGIGLHFANRS